MTVDAAAPDGVEIPMRFRPIDTEAVAVALADPERVLAHDETLDVETIGAVLGAIAAVACEERPWRDPRVLATLYYREGLTQSELGARLGTSQRTITRWMRKYDLSPDQRSPDVFDGLADLGLVERLLDDDHPTDHPRGRRDADPDGVGRWPGAEEVATIGGPVRLANRDVDAGGDEP